MQIPLIPTGIRDLDRLMGGFRVGDNVLLQLQVGTPPHAFVRAFVAEALSRGDRVTYASFDHSPATVRASLDGLPKGDLTILDCFTHGKGRSEDVFLDFYGTAPTADEVHIVPVPMPHHPSQFHRVFDSVTSSDRQDFILVDSLTGMQELWRKEERVREFYTHTCPRLFDTRALAVWLLNARVHSDSFRASIGHIAQVVISLDRRGEDATLRIERAVGRNRPETYRECAYSEGPGGVSIGPWRGASGRREAHEG